MLHFIRNDQFLPVAIVAKQVQTRVNIRLFTIEKSPDMKKKKKNSQYNRKTNIVASLIVWSPKCFSHDRASS